MKISKGAKLLILGVSLVIIDQIIKYLVKTQMGLYEEINLIGEWFKLKFVLNDGMAFGMLIGGVIGKAVLSVFRIVLFGGLCWWITRLIKKQEAPVGVLVGLTLITAGALGNIIDCLFYGIIWPDPVVGDIMYNVNGEMVARPISEYLYVTSAPFKFMFGKVVDMFYIPYRLPWMSEPAPLFGGIFNFADACVSCGAVYLLLFQYKFFAKSEKKQEKVQ